MNPQTLVSIIIPSYNSASYIEETLKSVSAQTYKNWEAIIIDDGSTDNSLEIINRYKAGDERISVFERNSELKGASVCRNIGLKKAQGEFVVFLDADDLLLNTCLEQRLMYAEKFHQQDFWVFSTLIFDQSPYDKNILLNVNTTENALDRFLRMDVVWLSTGPFWRTVKLKSIGGWDEMLQSGQDWELSVRTLITGWNFKYISEVDNFWRTMGSHTKISLGNKSSQHILLRLYLFNKIEGLLKENRKFDRNYAILLKNQYIQLSVNFLKNGMKRESMASFKQGLKMPFLPASSKIINASYYLCLYIGVFRNLFTNKLSAKNGGNYCHTFKKVLYNDHLVR
jgi:glycosyltransferase involved in cell wall biosynthesis